MIKIRNLIMKVSLSRIQSRLVDDIIFNINRPLGPVTFLGILNMKLFSHKYL